MSIQTTRYILWEAVARIEIYFCYGYYIEAVWQIALNSLRPEVREVAVFGCLAR